MSARRGAFSRSRVALLDQSASAAATAESMWEKQVAAVSGHAEPQATGCPLAGQPAQFTASAVKTRLGPDGILIYFSLFQTFCCFVHVWTIKRTSRLHEM